MGFLTSLKFDRYKGAVLVNDEVYSVRHRRKQFLDGIQSLLTPEMADAWGIEVLYTGVGSPWVHQQIIDATRRTLAERFDRQVRGKEQPAQAPMTSKDVAVIAAEHLQALIRYDMGQKLRLYYGFDCDDFTRSSFKVDGKSYDIKQDKVKAKVQEILDGKYSDRNSVLYKESKAHILAWDERNGVVGWHLDIKSGNVAFNMEAYEMLGIGKHALMTSLARLLNNVSYPQRQRGISPTWGMYELILAALAAREAYHATQGNFQIGYLDCSQKTHAKRYREFVDDQARCAVYAVQACEAGWLDRDTAYDLLDKALFKAVDRHAVERELFARSTNPTAVDLVLRGYKVHEVAELAATMKGATTKAPSSRKRRGA